MLMISYNISLSGSPQILPELTLHSVSVLRNSLDLIDELIAGAKNARLPEYLWLTPVESDVVDPTSPMMYTWGKFISDRYTKPITIEESPLY